MKYIQSYFLILVLMMGTAFVSQAQTTTTEEDTDPTVKAATLEQERDAKDVIRVYEVVDPQGNTVTTQRSVREEFAETLEPGLEDAQQQADLKKRQADAKAVELPAEAIDGKAYPSEEEGFEAKNDHDPVHQTNYDAQKQAFDEHFQAEKPAEASQGVENGQPATESATLKRADFTPDPTESRPADPKSTTLKRATTEQRNNGVAEDEKKN